MKPSEEMARSPAYLALGGSARSALRVILEEIDAPDGSVRLEAGFFLEAGLSTTAVKTGVADLMALGFVRVSGAGTAIRSFSLSEGWRGILDQAEARRCLAAARAAKAAQRSTRRRAAPAKAAAVDAGADRALPEGIRRAVWPQLAWQQGGAS